MILMKVYSSLRKYSDVGGSRIARASLIRRALHFFIFTSLALIIVVSGFHFGATNFLLLFVAGYYVTAAVGIWGLLAFGVHDAFTQLLHKVFQILIHCAQGTVHWASKFFCIPGSPYIFGHCPLHPIILPLLTLRHSGCCSKKDFVSFCYGQGHSARSNAERQSVENENEWALKGTASHT
jgi:hypothetical protein